MLNQVQHDSMGIKISVIIPTYKRKDSLIRFIKSLGKQLDESIEIIVVEQVFSNEKTFKDFAKKNKINLRYYFTKKLGTSLAKNIGVKNARGKIIIFFDDDIVAKSNLLKNLVQNFKDSEVGAVGGRVLTRGQAEEKKNINTGKITFSGKFTDGFSSKIRQEIETVIGCNSAWRKDIFDKIRGFDELFYGAIREDSDLSLRTLKAGYKIVFEPKAVVEHLREPTGGARKTEGRIQWYFNFFSNETYFFLKHRPKIILPIILLTRWEWILRCMFGFGREVSFRSIVTPFLGIYDGFKKYRRLKTKYAYWS